jgi:hypothetical protein
MALRAVPDHPKFAELMARLGRPKYQVLGVLESIWHFTGRFTPQGNIGKYTDAAIESWVGWEGQPGEFVNALIEAHWIDRHESFRLVVHDWQQHADNATKMALKRNRKTFCVHTVETPLQRGGDTVQQIATPLGLPVPVPEPVPVPVPDKKTKAPAKPKALPDPRSAEFREAFQNAFKVATNGVPAPWDVKEASNLSRFLKANPTITVEHWLRILYHRSISPLNQKASLSTWVARALSWLDAPADEWGKPINNGGGNRSGYGNRGQARTDGNLQAAKCAAANILRQDSGGIGGGAPSECEHGDFEPVLTGAMQWV